MENAETGLYTKPVRWLSYLRLDRACKLLQNNETIMEQETGQGMQNECVRPKDEMAVALGRRGGLATQKKHGRDHYVRMSMLAHVVKGKKLKVKFTS